MYTFRMARPSSFNQAIADQICSEIANGSNLLKVCALEGFPDRQTVYNWFKHSAEFFDNYARARQTRADFRADRIEEYCELVKTGQLDANSARVIIDAEKWQAAHEAPKVYGDRIQQNISGADGETLKIEVTGIRPTKENT